jgi:O-antigen/teichoic acid export membrane protein
VAREFILCTIGYEWIECVPLLQILCISGAFMPIYTLYQNLVISHGRSDINMWLNIGQIVLQLCIILLFYRQGITIMVMAYTIFNILWLGAWMPSAKRIIGLRFLNVLKDIVPFMFCGALVMVATHFVTMAISNIYLLLVVRVLIAAALYFGMMRLLNVVILRECMQFILKKK